MEKNAQENNSVSEKKPFGHTGLAGISLLVYLFDKLTDKIYHALIEGFFGYIFTAYSTELCAYNDGYVVSYFKGGKKTRHVLRIIRQYFSESFETSFVLRIMSRAVNRLAFMPLKIYGSFFMSFGIYTMLVYFIKLLIPAAGTADIDSLYIGIGLCIVTLPIYLSSQNLSEAVQKGKLTSALFVDAFGYREENFENKNPKKRYRSAWSVFWGLIAGILTFVISPIAIIVFLLLATVITLIIITPEIGVLFCLFALPFFSFTSNPTLLLTLSVLVTIFSYIIKIIRGKRIFKLELMDISVIIFFVLVLFSGAITFGGRPSYYSALVACCLLFGYFLVVNLIRTEKWLNRCIVALVSSGTVVAVIGVLQYIFGLAPNGWLDMSVFSDIEGRTVSLFENPNYLAAYLALVLPFTVFKAITAKSKKGRVLGFICCLMMIICTVFTWTRGAWVAVLVSVLLFFMIFSKKTMRLIFVMLASIPFLPFVLPKNVVNRFMSIGNLTDSSIQYRLYTWKGSLQMAKEYFWGGIGYGTEAFAQMYPMYSYAGIEAAVHTHSLYLQILIEMGIAGIACFALIAVLYIQKSFEYMKNPISRNDMLITAAALCSFVALLIMGIFDYVWYNYRIFFLFWVVMALGVCCVRIGKRELARHDIYEDFSDSSASVDLEF